MITMETVRELLARHGTVRPQHKSEWSGPFKLPAALVEYYGYVGPVDITIPGYGDPFFVPSLESLWEYQSGYRYNTLTEEPDPEWRKDWLVIADRGGDPFIFSRSTEEILFDYHGEGNWDPVDVFPDVETMAASLAIIGDLVRHAGADLSDARGRIYPEYYQEALVRLSEVLVSRSAAESCLADLGWG
jgi:hypothetical protein